MSSLMYTKFAQEYDAAVQNNIYNANLDRPSLISMLPELKNKHLLDLGCGPGVYAEFFVRNQAIVTLVDASKEMIQITKTKLGNSVHAYVQDLSLGIPNEPECKFDVVVSALTIHYIQNLLPLFKDIYRVLKTDGVFIFSTHHPLVDFTASPSGNYFRQEAITEHWSTLGRPIEVKYYRQPLTMLFDTIKQAGLCVTDLSEGKPSMELATFSPKHYERFSTRPIFLFIKCAKHV